MVVDLERDFAGNHRLAAIARPLHGFAAVGVLPHVITKRLDVQSAVGFGKNIDDIAIAAARRAHGEVGHAANAHFADQRREFGIAHGTGKGYRLQCGMVAFQFEYRDIIAPFLARHIFAAGKQRSGGAQGLGTVGKVDVEIGPQPGHLRIELKAQLVFEVLLAVAPGDEGQQQGTGERHPCRPEVAAE